MPNTEKWVWSSFFSTPAIPTYLVAFVVTELDHLETSYESIDGRNVSIRLWTRSDKLNQLEFAISKVPKILAALENYLNVPYSLPKLDLVAIPGYEASRAMENWGLIVHSETNLLADSGTESDIFERALVAITIGINTRAI